VANLNDTTKRVLDGFMLLDELTGESVSLYIQKDELGIETGASPVFAELVSRLNGIKRGLLWADESWESLLATAAQVEAFDDCVRIEAPSHVPLRTRVTEFSRRLALVERLLTVKSGEALTREDILTGLLAEVTLWSEMDVRDWLNEERRKISDGRLTDGDRPEVRKGWDEDHNALFSVPLPSITGLSGPSLSTDVRAMRELGFGFDPHPERVSRQPYRLDTQRLPLWVGVEEAEALRNAWNILREMNISDADVLERLMSRVPSAVQAGMAQWDLGRAMVGAGDPVDPKVFEALRHALRRQAKTMTIRYLSMSSDQPKRYYIENPQMNWFEGHMYLLAHCPGVSGANIYEKNREFRLDRFVNADGIEPIEVKPNAPSTAELPFFKLRFRAKPDLAVRFRTGPDGFKVHQPDPDGSCLVDVQEFTWLRAVRRLLSYGDRIAPIGPDFVVKRYYETLHKIASEAPIRV